MCKAIECLSALVIGIPSCLGCFYPRFWVLGLINMNVTLQLDKAAPVLAGLKKPIIVAKVDADKYRKLASKHEVE